VNEYLKKYKEKLLNFWKKLEKKQRIKLIGIIAFLVLSLSLFTILATKTKYELTYIDLNPKDAGTIVNKLEELNIPYKLSAGGKNISVPEALTDKVLVTIAQEENIGSGNIYSKFWEKASWGMTDSEFQLLERGAIEEKLRQLIVYGIQGISDAQVMITLPEDKVFYSDEQQYATASVVINLDPGVNLSPTQIKSIYHLISKSVPNLPVDNISLTDQYGEPLEYMTQDQSSINVSSYNQQRQIEREFQQDIKKEIESMLGYIMGPDHVRVSVFAKMNFDQKRTVSNLFEPVVDGKGIARSVEQIQESFTGTGNTQGGIVGTGSTQIPGYQAGTDNNGNYEHIEERINYEVNEITKEVISSPYHLEDLSITVVLDMPEDSESAGETKQAIKDLVKPIVSAALSVEDSNTIQQDQLIEQKIAVVAYEFGERISAFENQNNLNPLFLYGALGLAILAIGGFSYRLIRRKRQMAGVEEEEKEIKEKDPEFDFTPVLTEEAVLQQEILKMTKQKPDEFIKLLRTWLSED